MYTGILSWLAISLLLSPPSNALSLDCSHIRNDGKKFNFEELDGPHSVSDIEHVPPSIHNSTYTIDLCGPLEKQKNIASKEQCPMGTFVCGVVTRYDEDADSDSDEGEVDEVIPIAGNFKTGTGKVLDPQYQRLEDAADSKSTGLRIELHGGTYNKVAQQAIIDMQCDPERTGNEKSPVSKGRNAADDDDDGSDGDDDQDASSLRFVSYSFEGEDNKVKTLRLDWRTKYACDSTDRDDDDNDDDGGDDDEDDNKGSSNSKHWGFFTWLIIILFLGAASYLIFGAWLNYNRYGARGWDLLPHGDTIRDLPYLFKDWSRNLINTFSGGGSRGGYSAV